MAAAGVPVNDWLAAAGLGGATPSITALENTDEAARVPRGGSRFRERPRTHRGRRRRAARVRRTLWTASAEMSTLAPRAAALGRALEDDLVDDARSDTRAPAIPRGDVRAGIHARAVSGGASADASAARVPAGMGASPTVSRRGEDGTLDPEPADAWLTAFWNEMARAPPGGARTFRRVAARSRARRRARARRAQSRGVRAAAGSVRRGVFRAEFRADFARRGSLEDRWRWLAPLLRAANAPVLDVAAGGPGVCAATRGALADADASSVRTAADALAWKIRETRARLGSGRLRFDAVSVDDRDALFDLFVEQHPASGFAASPEGLETIKTIPMFATVSGARASISSGSFVTLPPGVAFADTLSRHEGLLVYRESARAFYAALGVDELADADVLARFIVPSLERAPRAGRVAALEFVRRRWSRLKDDDALRDALGSAKFVDANDTESLRAPRELYDPEVELLAAVFRGQPGSFPEGAWRENREWLAILRGCGLRSVVDAELFQTCASRVAARAVQRGIAFPLDDERRHQGANPGMGLYPRAPAAMSAATASLSPTTPKTPPKKKPPKTTKTPSIAKPG